MKVIFLALFLAISAGMHAQKPAKMTIVSGFWSDRYIIGDKDTKNKEVLLHLEKYCQPAYLYWDKSRRQQNIGLVFSIVGLGAAIYGVTSEDETVSSGFYTITSACVLTTLVCTLSSSKNRKKAVGLYNAQYNY